MALSRSVGFLASLDGGIGPDHLSSEHIQCYDGKCHQHSWEIKKIVFSFMTVSADSVLLLYLHDEPHFAISQTNNFLTKVETSKGNI